MTDGDDHEAQLSLGPSLLYPAKAAFTRARSLAWLARRRDGLGPGLRVLFYHRVSDDRDELAVSPRRFRQQMAYLADEGYRAVGLLEALESEGAERLLALTFDDGFRDVAENALPALADHGFRATVFVSTAVVDGTASFSWYAEQPPVLGWDEIERLDREGTLLFEAHSLTHPNLVALDDDTCRAEIAGSKQVLEEHLGRPVLAFCYPAGAYGERERRLVAEAGFTVATSVEPGLNLPGVDPLELRRTAVESRDALIDFKARLGGAHDSPPPLRAWYRRRRYSAGTGSPRSASSDR
ncbi:MAG: polysaccharide deacetylase family protein [Gaiellaceae bacterium]